MFEHLNPVRLIEEVKARPALYRSDQPADREEKLSLWKEVGNALFDDWSTFSKAMAYDRVLQLQKRWRSLRDAYNRELRARKTGVRINARVYRHFKRMTFLGGYDGVVSEDDEAEINGPVVIKPKRSRPKKPKIKEYERESSESEGQVEAFEMPMYNPTEVAMSEDTDKLFLLSFLPEIRQLPPKTKMWARAQIARVMQKAVASQYEPSMTLENEIKTRSDSDND